MEILSAYIRENSNARRPVDFPLVAWEPLKDDAREEERAAHLEWRAVRFENPFDSNARKWADSLPKPRIDVQLALTVIGRRSAQQRLVEAAWPGAPSKETIWPFDTDFKRLPDDRGREPLGAQVLADFKAGFEQWKKGSMHILATGWTCAAPICKPPTWPPENSMVRTRCFQVRYFRAHGWRGLISQARGWRARTLQERGCREQTSVLR